MQQLGVSQAENRPLNRPAALPKKDGRKALGFSQPLGVAPRRSLQTGAAAVETTSRSGGWQADTRE